MGQQSAPNRHPVRDRFYLLIVLALVPVILRPEPEGRDRLRERVRETVEAAPLVTRIAVARIAIDREATFGDVLLRLPDARLTGAHLSYQSREPWVYTALVAGAFGLALLVLFPLRRGEAPVLQLLTVMFLTGSVGVMLVLFTEVRAALLLFAAALDLPPWVQPPAHHFLLSFLCFVVVAALIEETGKLVPVYVQYTATGPLTWRATALWGLSAGAGFGAMEACVYAQSGYNGVSPVETYVVRFVSCVTLHAVWSAAAALTLCRQQRRVAWAANAVVHIGLLFRFALPTTALHAGFNFALIYAPSWVATAVALASFVWMAWQIERCRSREAAIPLHRAAVY
jgi:RsiW-degrading membrane proteinase PrsW (M82 family)